MISGIDPNEAPTNTLNKMKRTKASGSITPSASIPAPNQATTEIVPNSTKMMKAMKAARTFAPFRTTPR